MQERAGRRVAAVERALAVLDALAAAGGAAVGVNELARTCEINASTVSRLLGTLAAHGMVERDADSGRYRLGLHVVTLADAALARRDLRGLARPYLERLVAATGETATLSLAAGAEAVTADFVPSPRSIASVARVGRPSLAHATAVGQVVLAFTPGALERLPARLARYTANTVTDRAKLAARVAQVRAQGHAGVEGEREDGLNALAVPVIDHGGALAGVIGLQGPERFDVDARARALPLARAAADALSAALGAHPERPRP